MLIFTHKKVVKGCFFPRIDPHNEINVLLMKKKSNSIGKTNQNIWQFLNELNFYRKKNAFTYWF